MSHPLFVFLVKQNFIKAKNYKIKGILHPKHQPKASTKYKEEDQNVKQESLDYGFPPQPKGLRNGSPRSGCALQENVFLVTKKFVTKSPVFRH